MRLEKVRLGDVCIFENGDRGKNYPSQTAFISEGIPFINTGNLSNNLIDNKGVNYISEEHFNRLSNGKVQINDILFCLRGSLGKYAINRSVKKGAIASSLVILRAKDNIYYKFLSYFLSTPAFREMVDKANNGSSQPNLSASSVKDFKIPLPPLPQQQKIANILDAADALRQNDKTLIAKYDELIQALFLEMFGDPVSNPKGWEKVELKKLGKVITGSTPPSSKENMFGGDIPFVTPGDLDKNQPYKRFVTEEGALNSRTVNKGSLFVCCIGATIGKTGIARELCTFNQQINAVEWFNKINFQFGYICFTSLKKELIEKAISTTLPIMKKSEFEKLKMICPPIELQKQFEERVKVIEGQKAIAQKSLEKSEELFNSLLQRAFKGELA